MPDPLSAPLSVHGTAIAVDGQGILLLGDSGSGKSSAALGLITQHGATLVADDQVHLVRCPSGGLRMTGPSRLRGIIEVRELGLLRLPTVPTPCPLGLLVRLVPVTERLPMPPVGQDFEILLETRVPVVRLMALGPLNPIKILMALRIVTGQLETVDDLAPV